jgi:hypothetical protein
MDCGKFTRLLHSFIKMVLSGGAPYERYFDHPGVEEVVIMAFWEK